MLFINLLSNGIRLWALHFLCEVSIVGRDHFPPSSHITNHHQNITNTYFMNFILYTLSTIVEVNPSYVWKPHSPKIHTWKRVLRISWSIMINQINLVESESVRNWCLHDSFLTRTSLFINRILVTHWEKKIICDVS